MYTLTISPVGDPKGTTRGTHADQLAAAKALILRARTYKINTSNSTADGVVSGTLTSPSFPSGVQQAAYVWVIAPA
jgi:hypothetical protein